MFQHAAITALSTGIVVDKAKIAGLDAVAMSAFFAQTYGLGLPVTIVDSAGAFFNSQNLLKLLENNNAAWELVAEKLGIKLDATDLATIQRAIEIRKDIIKTAQGMVPEYPFADVPGGWTLDRLTITKSRIGRNDDGRGYYATIQQLKEIWLRASPFWSGKKDNPPAIIYRGIGGHYDKAITTNQAAVSVGCQTIQRFELEQVALHLGWEFP